MSDPEALSVRQLTAAQISEFLTWAYEGPYAMYDMREEDPATAVAFFSDPANGYFALVDAAGTLLGFCNFGADARVPGGTYVDEALDIGMGMRPDLTGQGRGAIYARAVFDFARATYPARRQRVTIATFNERAQRLCQGLGFAITDRFERPGDGRPFVIMTRDLPPAPS